ncbi:MAG: glycosyltransferase, partial [Chitinophagales bacterium]
MNNVGIAISTLNDGIFRIENICRAKADAVLVLHQVTDIAQENEYRKYYSMLVNEKVSIHTMHEKGLAKSRNYCIKNINTKYAVISDDDIIMEPLLYEHLIDFIHQYPDTAVFTGRIKADNQNHKKKYAHHT